MKRVWVYVAPPRGGLIVLWSGSLETIPSGARLCDGTSGTPDLRDYFVLGTSYEYEQTAAARKTGDEGNVGVLLHSHGYEAASEWAHTHGVPDGVTVDTHSVTTGAGASGGDTYSAEHEHPYGGSTGPGTPHEHSGAIESDDAATVDLRPPWYALAYVMINADVPIGGMALAWLGGDPYGTWDDELGDYVPGSSPVPAGYVLCDGENDTPNMDGQYVIGANADLSPGSFYGNEYGRFQIASHQHGDGTLEIDPEAAHRHELFAHGMWPSSEYDLGSVAAGVGLLGGANSPKIHGHHPSHEVVLAEASSHTHAMSSLNAVASTWQIYGQSLPRSFRLHWVMRVSEGGS